MTGRSLCALWVDKETAGLQCSVSPPHHRSWSVLFLQVWLHSLSLWSWAVEPTYTWKMGANATEKASWKLSWRLSIRQPLSLHLHYSASSKTSNFINQDVHRKLNLMLLTKKSNTTKRMKGRGKKEWICPFLYSNINLLLPLCLRHTEESWA